MTQINRRGLLGSAALGAGGLIGLAGEARAASPGGSGFGRNVTALPPSDKVVPHERGEKEGMPDFKYSLDGSTPKVTSGGWAKKATVHQFPILLSNNFGVPEATFAGFPEKPGFIRLPQ